jgi:hypothetical protein
MLKVPGKGYYIQNLNLGFFACAKNALRRRFFADDFSSHRPRIFDQVIHLPYQLSVLT